MKQIHCAAPAVWHAPAVHGDARAVTQWKAFEHLCLVKGFIGVCLVTLATLLCLVVGWLLGLLAGHHREEVINLMKQ